MESEYLCGKNENWGTQSQNEAKSPKTDQKSDEKKPDDNPVD